MATILCIETSTSVCSVALCHNGTTIASEELYEANSHATSLTLLIEALFKSTPDFNLKNIDAVAVSSGPGSYTGLRIGVSTAKGLCYALNTPLIAINSLMVMTQAALEAIPNKAEQVYVPLMDARRMEVYTCTYDHQLNELKPIEAKIIEASSFDDLLAKKQALFFGDGAKKCSTIIQHENATFLEHIDPLAKHLGPLAEAAYNNSQFENVAYFEPFYLKDFVVTTSKKKLL